MRAAVIVALAALLAVRSAHAQSTDVPALVKLVQAQPANMDKQAWKEHRRDAARKLGESKDKRAVPVLVQLADVETFDIIGEIAIDGLGALGDPSAIPELQKIAADASRDPEQRDHAKKALAKLGATPTPATAAQPAQPPSPPTAPETGLETASGDTGDTAPATTEPASTAILGPQPAALPPLPAMSDDVLAAYDRVTFAAGNAALSYDTITKRLDAQGSASGEWQKRIERERYAWGVDAGASVLAGIVNPPGRANQRGFELDANADGEGRYYIPHAYGVYGIVRAAAALDTDYVGAIDANTAANDFRETLTTADLQLAVGAGFGRTLDVGGAIRVRRLARALAANRALGKPIDAATAKQLQLTWWALRAERSTYRALLATIAVLRQAGVLLGEPDAGITYEILNVLRDSYLYVRPSGLDVNAEYSAGYIRLPAGTAADNFEHGGVEQVLANAGYAAQLAEDKLELVGSAYARVRLEAPAGQPSPWAIGATATATRFTYGEHGDPFGTFDVTALVQYSGDDRMNVDSGFEVGAQLGFTYLINQASGLRLAGQVALDDGEFLFGATLTATYGLLDGTYAR